MLKTKLYKVCFIMSGFIFMAASSGSSSISKKNVFDQPAINIAITNQVDTSGLSTTAPVVVKEKLLTAPEIQLNKNAAPFVKEYITKNGFFLGKTKGRIAPYFTIMDSVFAQNALPVELKYLSFVESGLQYNAKSFAGAVGPWALMPVAAKEYGLKINGKKDERLDYNKSTNAAAALLSDLFAKYGDWLLVIAAYNCGPGGVQKAIKKSGSRNYWSLQQFLPEETRKHVKKFIAVHYYFEGHGSMTTMSKTEMEKYIKASEAFVAQQLELANPVNRVDSVTITALK